MWAVRKSANPIRIVTNRAVISRICGVNLELPINTQDNNSLIKEPSSNLHFYFPSPFLYLRNFSTESDPIPKSIENNSEDSLTGFSDLDNSDSDSESNESELTIEDESNSKSDSKLKKFRIKQYDSPLFKLILGTHKDKVPTAIENWFKEGNNEIEREDIYSVLYSLRTRKLFIKALKLLEFLQNYEGFKFTEREYVTFVDLIAKVRGLSEAEKYFEKIPQNFKTERIYGSLLANSVALRSVEKAEKIFNKMRELGFELSQFTCNQLLLLYKRTDKEKVNGVLEMMEKENVKKTVFMFNTLLDIKGKDGDISGMEEILKNMKKEGLKPSIYTHSMVAKHYIKHKMKEKAEKSLREMEGSENNKHRPAFRYILPLYADLNKASDVERVWKLCESDPFMEESLSAIYSFGKIGEIEKAEKVFDGIVDKWNKVSVKYYDQLLKVYADNKMLEKGKNLLRKMLNEGRIIMPSTLDNLIRLYVNCDEVKKGDVFLQKWMEETKIKPMYNTYLSLLEGYANKGDYHNAENIFGMIKKTNFYNKGQNYNLVLRGYVNAKVPAYGIRERMKYEGVVFSDGLKAQLAVLDGFRKNKLVDLLD